MSKALRSTVNVLLPRSVATKQLRATDSKKVLLTFDDGPDPEVTPGVLDRLKAFGARAVFFIPGCRIERAPRVLNRILEEGHVLGNHSFEHDNRRNRSYGRIYRDLVRCQEALVAETGQRPVLYRPPQGRVTFACVLAARRLGLRTVLWSRDVSDWRFRHDDEARAGAEELLASASPRDIILLHDDNLRVLTILDILLPGLASRGLDLADALPCL